MPSYKSHSVHGEIVLSKMDNKLDIDNEDIKTFSFGPDSMIFTDHSTFSYQHHNDTKKFFLNLLELIKNKNLQNNPEVMAFLYGQINHFVLDSTLHPYIYFITEGIDSDTKFSPHCLVEMWIDDYIIDKYDKKDFSYYHKLGIKDKELNKLIDELYEKTYGKSNISLKYNLGIKSLVFFDTVVRRNAIGIVPIASRLLKSGDIVYSDSKKYEPYLNNEKKEWRNPETGEKNNYSFDELWDKSILVSLDTINDVNNYLYNGKELTNELIMNNTSYNTGLDCEKGQTLKYVKKYRSKK